MLVTRRNYKRNRPNGPLQNGVQRENKNRAQQVSKDGTKSTPQEKEGVPSNTNPKEGKGPMAQQVKSNVQPNVLKPRTFTPVAHKRKGTYTHADYNFDFNPLLKQQTQAHFEKPTFKPTNGIIIDLNPSSPLDSILPDAPPNILSGKPLYHLLNPNTQKFL